MKKSEDRSNIAISRRKLLKALAASAGSLAVSLVIPGEWKTPVVEIGVLPAHAQMSQEQQPTCCSEITIINATTDPDAWVNINYDECPDGAGFFADLEGDGEETTLHCTPGSTFTIETDDPASWDIETVTSSGTAISSAVITDTDTVTVTLSDSCSEGTVTVELID